MKKLLTIKTEASPCAVSGTEPLPPGFAQDRLEAFMAAVSGPIKEAHVIIFH